MIGVPNKLKKALTLADRLAPDVMRWMRPTVEIWVDFPQTAFDSLKLLFDDVEIKLVEIRSEILPNFIRLASSECRAGSFNKSINFAINQSFASMLIRQPNTPLKYHLIPYLSMENGAEIQYIPSNQ